MNRTELARTFNVSLTTIDNWYRRGCPCKRHGKGYDFDVSAVIKWRDENLLGGNGSGSSPTLDDLPGGFTGNPYRDFTYSGIELLSRYLISNLGPAFTGLLSRYAKLSPAVTRALYIGTASFIKYYIFQFLRDDIYGDTFKKMEGTDIDNFHRTISPRADTRPFDADEFEKQTANGYTEVIKPIFEQMKKAGDFDDPLVREILLSINPGMAKLWGPPGKSAKRKEGHHDS